MMGLGKPNLKSPALAVAVILEGKPQISGNSPSPGPHPVFFIVGFDDGLWQTLQLHAIFEVAGFINYGSIRESVFKRQIRFLSHPLGQLGVTYGLHL